MRTVRIILAIGIGAAIAMGAAAKPAFAISVELAKKCRDLALKAHPYKLPGVKGGQGNAEAERSYYSDCLAKGGKMPDTTTQDAAPAQAPSQAPAPGK